MQVKNTRYCWTAAVVIVVAATMQACAHAASGSHGGTFAGSVSKLYARYAWVVVFSSSSPPDFVSLTKANQHELLDAFTPDLAQAIWDDAQCAKKRGEICVLDFDVLFNSQDPNASELTVEAGARDNEALACFKDSTGQRTCLTFLGASIDGTDRVFDIVYPGQRSLRRLLGLADKKSR